jgi:hypothetical protein
MQVLNALHYLISASSSSEQTMPARRSVFRVDGYEKMMNEMLHQDDGSAFAGNLTVLLVLLPRDTDSVTFLHKVKL